MNVIKPRREHLTGGTPMTRALTPSQCAEMRRCLRMLVHYTKGRKVTRKELTDYLWQYHKLQREGRKIYG